MKKILDTDSLGPSDAEMIEERAALGIFGVHTEESTEREEQLILALQEALKQSLFWQRVTVLALVLAVLALSGTVWSLVR